MDLVVLFPLFYLFFLWIIIFPLFYFILFCFVNDRPPVVKKRNRFLKIKSIGHPTPTADQNSTPSKISRKVFALGNLFPPVEDFETHKGVLVLMTNISTFFVSTKGSFKVRIWKQNAIKMIKCEHLFPSLFQQTNHLPMRCEHRFQ